MSVDVESALARLGTAWSASVAHVDVTEVLERTMATGSQPIDDMGDLPATSRHRMRAESRSRRSGQRWLVTAACTALVVAGVMAVALRPAGGPEPAATDPATTPSPGPFVGVWVSTAADGASQTMEIVRSGTDEYEVVLRNDAETRACAGAAATMIGSGRLVTDVTLLIAQPVLTCDDGSVPAIGPPPQADIANFTFNRDPVADELTDSSGVVWRRAGSNDEQIAPASETSGGMWPQSTLDEVRAAQELADAGDPASTWQLDAELAAEEDPWGAEIFARLIEEELGWEEFISGASFSEYTTDGEGRFRGVFVRCAPGQRNPLSPLYSEAPGEIRGCAPTIDELTYETVSVTVTQPERRGPSGIWVVDRWEMLQSPYDPISLWNLLYPDFDQSQVEQVAPPSDAEVTALLEAFLRARVDGEGAEQYLHRETEESPFEDNEVPLLYTTTSGTPYRRSELQRQQGPVWPGGWLEYKVRLFAEGETVVDQDFYVIRDENGQLGLVHGRTSDDASTTENGQPEGVTRTEFAGTLTLTAPPLVPRGDGRLEISLTDSGGRVIIGEDPVPVSPIRDDCLPVAVGTALPIADDATVLARNIEADPDFETNETVPVSIAGIDGLQMDVTFSEQDLCYTLWSPSRRGSGTGPQGVPADDWRMRLYLVDYPQSAWPSNSNWRPRVLTVAIIAPEPDFERVVELAAPIVESLEFRPR